ncbi:hypothetical protein FRUB_03952 [Fimbriiglobus ruber]|uniref:Uncharacterized protein n=1 Tax=Fimbriiglobus ruber TaxID=1908690 RepID=A0A225DQI2_9BACT|nr:hypothetical protein FRUB_03952 [Fimbriiglobus ruber]
MGDFSCDGAASAAGGAGGLAAGGGGASTVGEYDPGTGNVFSQEGHDTVVPAAVSGNSRYRKQFGQICRITADLVRVKSYK